jgi:hypothetical protein
MILPVLIGLFNWNEPSNFFNAFFFHGGYSRSYVASFVNCNVSFLLLLHQLFS